MNYFRVALPGTNPDNFLEAHFGIVSVLPFISGHPGVIAWWLELKRRVPPLLRVAKSPLQRPGSG